MSVTDWIDFSVKHDTYIRNPDGSFNRMDEPFFQAEQVADRTWKILSSGDYSYLLEGDERAVAIDTGYGAGNIRKFMQMLTKKPLDDVINTHDHFDHTAGNGYFEKAFLSEKTAGLATRPFPSFEGIFFPRNYEKEILREGDIFSLGDRKLQVFLIPDHAPGSIALLDREERLLFTGDEFMPGGKRMNGSLSAFYGHVNKLLKYRDGFDRICAGMGVFEAGLLEQYRECLEFILSGHEGEVPEPENFALPEVPAPNGTMAYDRRLPHPEDVPKGKTPEERQYLRRVRHGGVSVTYDIRRQ